MFTEGVAGVTVDGCWLAVAGAVVSDVCGKVADAGLAVGVALFAV